MKSTIGSRPEAVSQEVRPVECQSVITPQNQRLLLEGIHAQEPIAGFTHGFYKYPARFSPLFARSVIRAFTEPGETVYDPFMGGGTTIVEAAAMGRRGIGTDINSLAVFLAEVKTTVFRDSDRASIRRWANKAVSRLSIWSDADRSKVGPETHYQRNINTRATWRMRKLLELGLIELQSLRSAEQRRFVRCALLRTAQWALDCRKEIPSAQEFRQQLLVNIQEMLTSAARYARTIARTSMRKADRLSSPVEPLCLHRSAVGIETESLVARTPIKLVLTSPPYPGVHVLYHRWQVQGRRETPAPYWIANLVDGNGASYYTFGDRKQAELESYYDQARAAFTSIARISDLSTVVVQMIAFSEPSWQLPRYLTTMDQAGFAEFRFSELANSKDGRVWRSVPNRKWYASQRGSLGSSNEVVLFHRLIR